MNMIKTLVASALLAVSFSTSAAVITFDNDMEANGKFKINKKTDGIFSFELFNSSIVSFDWRMGDTNGLGDAKVNVFLNGKQFSTSGQKFADGTSKGAWDFDSGILTLGPLAAGTHTLTFQSLVNGNYNGKGAFSMAVAPVPEPETYALMGMGLVGLLAARRRKAKQA